MRRFVHEPNRGESRIAGRTRWHNVNDVAIWDNRSVYHVASTDYEGMVERLGQRAVGIRERPYLEVRIESKQEASQDLSKESNGGVEDKIAAS